MCNFRGTDYKYLRIHTYTCTQDSPSIYHLRVSDFGRVSVPISFGLLAGNRAWMCGVGSYNSHGNLPEFETLPMWEKVNYIDVFGPTMMITSELCAPYT